VLRVHSFVMMWFEISKDRSVVDISYDEEAEHLLRYVVSDRVVHGVVS
jgi:hypothetical protein